MPPELWHLSREFYGMPPELWRLSRELSGWFVELSEHSVELPGMTRGLLHPFPELYGLFTELYEHSIEPSGMAIELYGMPHELWRQIPECVCPVNESAKNSRKMVRMVRVLTGGNKELTERLLRIGPDFSELGEIVGELIGVLRQLSLSLLNITGKMQLLLAHLFLGDFFSYI